MHAHGDPDLGQHGVAGGAEEALDPEVLLDPLEEEFDLPAGFVDVCDGSRREVEVVGEEGVALARLGVPIADPTQPNRAVLPALLARELDGLVRGHAAAGGITSDAPEPRA